MKKIDLTNWPFGPLVGFSLCLSVSHGIAQLWWVALRYKTPGPRPPTAQAFIALETLVQMLVLTIAMEKICGENRSTSRWKYIVGELAALGAWVIASFVL